MLKTSGRAASGERSASSETCAGCDARSPTPAPAQATRNTQRFVLTPATATAIAPNPAIAPMTRGRLVVGRSTRLPIGCATKKSNAGAITTLARKRSPRSNWCCRSGASTASVANSNRAKNQIAPVVRSVDLPSRSSELRTLTRATPTPGRTSRRASASAEGGRRCACRSASWSSTVAASCAMGAASGALCTSLRTSRGSSRWSAPSTCRTACTSPTGSRRVRRTCSGRTIPSHRTRAGSS